MKKILTVIIPTLLISNISVLATQKISRKNNQIIWNLNINENKNLNNDGRTDEGKIENKIFYFNYLTYASNLNEFASKYPHFSFSNGDYINASIYQKNETHYLNKTYNTSDLLSSSQGLLIDHLIAEVPGKIDQLINLNTWLMSFNNKLNFWISYDSSASFLPVVPSYKVLMNQISFFNF